MIHDIEEISKKNEIHVHVVWTSKSQHTQSSTVYFQISHKKITTDLKYIKV